MSIEYKNILEMCDFVDGITQGLKELLDEFYEEKQSDKNRIAGLEQKISDLEQEISNKKTEYTKLQGDYERLKDEKREAEKESRDFDSIPSVKSETYMLSNRLE